MLDRFELLIFIERLNPVAPVRQLMDFVRLTTIENSYEAHFLKEDLDMEGIPSFLTNENLTNLIPMSFVPTGLGIQVMVRQEDLGKAKQILAKREQLKKIISCPSCESSNIRLGPDRTSGGLFSIVLALIGFLPYVDPRDRYFCNNCMKEFLK